MFVTFSSCAKLAFDFLLNVNKTGIVCTVNLKLKVSLNQSVFAPL